MPDNTIPAQPSISGSSTANFKFYPIRWIGEHVDENHYGYIGDVLFYIISKHSQSVYKVAGLPSTFPHTANSLESSKEACIENFKAFLSKSGLAVKS